MMRCDGGKCSGGGVGFGHRLGAVLRPWVPRLGGSDSIAHLASSGMGMLIGAPCDLPARQRCDSPRRRRHRPLQLQASKESQAEAVRDCNNRERFHRRHLGVLGSKEHTIEVSNGFLRNYSPPQSTVILATTKKLRTDQPFGRCAVLNRTLRCPT